MGLSTGIFVIFFYLINGTEKAWVWFGCLAKVLVLAYDTGYCVYCKWIRRAHTN